jgi:hypothetical protein
MDELLRARVEDGPAENESKEWLRYVESAEAAVATILNPKRMVAALVCVRESSPPP